MRLIFISTLPETYLRTFYSDHPQIESAGYEEHHSKLMYDSCYWSDSWAEALRPYGYDVSVIIANARHLQETWAAERRVDFQTDTWFTDIVMAQVSSGSPDVLIFNNYTAFNSEFINGLRENNPGIRSVIGWCGAPYRDGRVFGTYDLVLSCLPELVDHFRENGHRSELFPHSFDKRILNRIRPDPVDHFDFTFVGSIIAKDSFHKTRETLLLELVRRTNIQIFTDKTTPGLSTVIKSRLALMAYGLVRGMTQLPIVGDSLAKIPPVTRILGWDECPQIPKSPAWRILARANPSVYGRAMFQRLHDSRVSLNTHIDFSPNSASNMRLFEVTGMKSCLLTDWKQDLSRYFEPDKEVITYRSASECVEKALYLMDHEGYRAEIAQAGHARVMREHTFDERAPLMIRCIESTL